MKSREKSSSSPRKKGIQPFVRRLRASLAGNGLSPAAIAQIMAGSDAMVTGVTPEAKARWNQGAIQRMDRLLDRQTRIRVREGCACSLTPWRLGRMRKIRRGNPDFDDFVAAVQESGLMGAGVKRTGKRVLVRFGTGGCVCHAIRAAGQPVSITYCQCCKGHLMGLLEAALGGPVRMDIVESHISGGRDCRFVFYPEPGQLR